MPKRLRLKTNQDVFSSMGNPWVTEKDRDEYHSIDIPLEGRSYKRVPVPIGDPLIDQFTKAAYRGSDSRLKVSAAFNKPTVRSLDGTLGRINRIRSAMAIIRKAEARG